MKQRLRPNSPGGDRINSALPADPREVIPTIAACRGETLAELSRMLSRCDGYLARFCAGGPPIALHERDHRLLADHPRGERMGGW